MRKITEIIIHCSATPEDRDYTVEDIDRWHRAQGWQCIGYHYVIYRDGTIHPGRPIEIAGAHCLGHNAHSIGICYIGGLRLKPSVSPGTPETYEPADTRTPAQRTSLHTLIRQLKAAYPEATIHGHNEFARKACPCFDVQGEFSQDVSTHAPEGYL